MSEGIRFSILNTRIDNGSSEKWQEVAAQNANESTEDIPYDGDTLCRAECDQSTFCGKKHQRDRRVSFAETED